MPIKILLPVVKTNTGSHSFILRLADGLKKYSELEIDIVEYPLICEVVPWLMRKNFSEKRYDIVLANSPYAFRFRDVADRLIVVELHSIFNEDFYVSLSFFQRLYNRLIIQGYIKASFSVADHAVAISHFTEADVRKQFPNISLSTIHCWIEVDLFLMLEPAPDFSRDGDQVFELLFVGSLSARKGARFLPELASALGSGFRIKCVSKDAAFPFQNVPENLALLGELNFDELIQAYQSCDAVISLSSFEGFGYTLAEALSCGKPVVAFDIGPFREVLPASLHRYLAKKNDIEDFVRCCMLLSEDLRRQQINSADLRKHVEHKFSPEIQVGRYIHLFRSIASVQ